jgi:hypothetical protein
MNPPPQKKIVTAEVSLVCNCGKNVVGFNEVICIVVVKSVDISVLSTANATRATFLNPKLLNNPQIKHK